MPSEPPAVRPPRQPWAWLWSQGLGVLCGQATVLLLAVGSVVLATTRDGASAAIGMDDVRGFFSPPSPVHAWLYLLLAVLGLYALNTLLATWRDATRKWRSGLRRPRVYAAALVHLGFLLGLLAHGVGGLFGAESRPVLLADAWQEVGLGRQARLARFERSALPDGGVKQIYAGIALRDASGREWEETLSYNGPISSGFGSDLLLLARATSVPAARFARASARSGIEVEARGELEKQGRCEIEVDGGCELGDLRVELLYIHPPRVAGSAGMARLRVSGPAVGGRVERWIAERQPWILTDGSTLAFEGMSALPAVLVRVRHAPGNPWALAASIVLLLGLVSMWRRLGPVPPAAPAASPPSA